MNDDSYNLSIDENNTLREKLGLKPIDVSQFSYDYNNQEKSEFGYKQTIEIFKSTGDNYLEYCNEHKYEVSDFVRRTFRDELKLLLSNGQFDDVYIYFKLCGDNEIVTDERVKDVHLQGFCDVLAKDMSIKSLDLRFNRISDAGAENIGRLLMENRNLEELNLMGNDIGEIGAQFIGEALTKNRTLKILKLNGNKIGCDGGMHIARALQINQTLEELDLGECDLKIQSVIAFATVLKCNTTLKSLNLERPILWTQQEETTVHMENMLYQNSTLEELHLGKYLMRDFGMERLCDALILNTSLKVLDLSSNRITRDGAKIMARVLAKNTPLRVLDLAFNRIHDDGITAIAKALGYCNTNLKCLVVKSNEIGENGLLALIEAMEINITLNNVYIWGNTFSSKVGKTFSNLLDSYRLMESQTDVRPYIVDGQYYFAELPHNVDYRLYRYTAPMYGSDVPKNRSYAIV